MRSWWWSPIRSTRCARWRGASPAFRASASSAWPACSTPCAAYLQGEYGINDLYVGVPIKLGKNGMEQIIEITLTEEERAELDKSAAAVKELFEKLKTGATANVS